ncbi:MORN repeat-containing protein 1-like isoform X2 [Mytilus californianus]|uniref:MORN repeat-containing protein 1-like isoform X2 n=1 Tax=Mytilus californianus TaxID=6549 RepID=UPI002246203D|nr:MORN repeat-containing protein 1-like isoform X2 [Mytilus californianus]
MTSVLAHYSNHGALVKMSSNQQSTLKLRRLSVDEFVLPKIHTKKIKRVNSERKPFSVNPFPKLGTGHGVYVFENQYFRYEGEWVKGKKHGFGKLLLKDGTYYEGQFNQGEITGTGFKFFSETKCKYKGQFVKGEMHGRGIMEFPDSSEYEGNFVHNRKNGYGIMRTPLTQYDGGYQSNMRHGEGRMVYANGDRYEGYWVADKRHGPGVLHCADGSIFDGNFDNDEFHGHGLYRHISGVIYDGMWLKGFPAKMASKLHIVVENTPMIIRQGTPFTITVQCLNEENEVVGDDGREIQITAGFKYYQPSKGSALFDMIEDVEDKPIDTPFGYQVVHYPLTNQEQEQDGHSEEDDKDEEQELSQSQTQLDLKEDEDENQNNKEDETKEGEDGEKFTENEKQDEEKDDGVDTSGGGVEEVDENPNDTTLEKESIPLPPPVPNCRSEEGICVWNEVYLAPAPPMYRPFVAMEEAENDKKSTSKGKPAINKDDRRSSIVPDQRRQTIHDPGNIDRRGSVYKGLHKVVAAAKIPSILDKMRRQKEKALEEKYAKTGEYVLMVHDVTNPPFLGRTLDPAFLLLKLKRPEAKKRTKKEGKKWDTSQHIKRSMVATEELDD